MKKAAAVFLSILLLSAVGLVLWGKDEPLSEQTTQLLQKPAAAEGDDTYFSLLGFTSPADKNPTEAGRQMATLRKADELHFTENVLSTCDKDRVGEIACIVQNRAQVEKTLSDNKVLLDRYMA